MSILNFLPLLFLTEECMIFYISMHECHVFFRRKSNILVIRHQIVEQQYLHQKRDLIAFFLTFNST